MTGAPPFDRLAPDVVSLLCGYQARLEIDLREWRAMHAAAEQRRRPEQAAKIAAVMADHEADLAAITSALARHRAAA